MAYTLVVGLDTSKIVQLRAHLSLEPGYRSATS